MNSQKKRRYIQITYFHDDNNQNTASKIDNNQEVTRTDSDTAKRKADESENIKLTDTLSCGSRNVEQIDMACKKQKITQNKADLSTTASNNKPQIMDEVVISDDSESEKNEKQIVDQVVISDDSETEDFVVDAATNKRRVKKILINGKNFRRARTIWNWDKYIIRNNTSCDNREVDKQDSAQEKRQEQMEEKTSEMAASVSKKRGRHKCRKQEAKVSENDTGNVVECAQAPQKVKHPSRRRCVSVKTTEKLDVVNQIQIKMETTEQAISHSSSGDMANRTDALMAYFEKGKITYRLMKRSNFILNIIRQDKVIVDMMKLIRAIREEESKEGYKAAIDKKSLLRLILKLSQFGLIKFRKVTLKSDSLEKYVYFICDVNIDDEHAVITSALEQCKMKFFMTQERRSENLIQEKDLPKRSKNNIQTYDYTSHVGAATSEQEPIKIVRQRSFKMGKKYGLLPKFLRDRLLHELLFYLIHEHTEEPVTNQQEIEKIFEEFGGSDKVFENDNFMTVYHRDLSWKMFIPPLPQHQGWPKGWIFVSDILLRLPLHIFVRCVNLTFEVPNIDYYLMHPVRQFFLIKNLPARLRTYLLGDRKFVYSVNDSLKRLCFMGLCQFGPQRLKEKDQVFVYLNKKASLYNTVTSPPGYIKVSADVRYDKTDYTFKSSHDLEQYWHDMWFICMNTSLGHRSTAVGETLVLEQPLAKPELMETVMARTVAEVEQFDTGNVPGDRRGAAGLDSSLYAHLKRNWNWTTIIPINNDKREIKLESPQAKKPGSLSPDKSKIKSEQQSPQKQKERKETKEATTGEETRAEDTEAEEIEAEERKSENVHGAQEKTLALQIKSKKGIKTKHRKAVSKIVLLNKGKKRIIRRIHPRKVRARKIWYDEKDIQCLKKMSKLRTDWSPVEDHCILLFTVAMIYLFPNPRKNKVDYTVMRDLLHKLVPDSTEKTSRAVQRRKSYIMKNLKTRRSVFTCLEEIYNCDYVTERFAPLVNKHQSSVIPISTLNVAFIELICVLNKKFSSHITGRSREVTREVLPDTLAEIEQKYEYNLGMKKYSTKYSDVKTIYDIHYDVVRSVIHSSLCTSKDKTSWAVQLFKIYHQYPESLLRQVVNKIRIDQMVSLKKIYKTRNSASIIQTPLKLSINYANQLRTNKIQFESLIEANTFLQDVILWLEKIKTGHSKDRDLEITFRDYGTAMITLDVVQKLNLEFNFEHPEQVIVLDPVLQKDKTYERIVNKYHDLLNDVNTWDEEDVKSEDSDSEDDNFPHLDVQQLAELNKLNAADQRPSTRMAFHMMRAILSMGNKNLQHMHDYFVVQPTKMWMVLIDENVIDTFMGYKGFAKPLIEDIKHDTIVPDFYSTPLLDEARTYFKEIQLTLSDFEYIEKIKCRVKAEKELGITVEHLKNVKPDSKGTNLSLKTVLEFLKHQNIILKVGVSAVRYVHFDFKKPWLVHTDKMLRLDREKMDSKKIVPNKWKGKWIPKGAKEEDQKKMKLVIAPWIRLDGSVNRRVLDRWMGCITSVCVEEAGIKLVDLVNKKTYLKPTEIVFIIELLVKLKCVTLLKVKRPKVTLFSNDDDYTVEQTDILDDMHKIIIEPTEDILINFCAFIGQRTYNTNFME